MSVNRERYEAICLELAGRAVLVAVSKTKPVEDIASLYERGQRDFGENYVQELVAKEQELPKDIRWHFIGHLQSNKIKYIAPFVHLIHGIDSLRLLREVSKAGAKLERVLDVLLQVHIAREETKFGFSPEELQAVISPDVLSALPFVRIRGLMGMASLTPDEAQIRSEFSGLKALFESLKPQLPEPHRMEILSMGMSADYLLALAEGSTLVRVGSLIFGERS